MCRFYPVVIFLCLCSRKLCKLLEISAGFAESSLEVSRLAAVRLVELLVAAASCPRPLRPAHAALRPLPINGIAASNRPPATAGKWAIPSHPLGNGVKAVTATI